MKNSADLGGCYPPRPSASVDNTLLDLQNSSCPTQPHSIIAKYCSFMYLIVDALIELAHEQHVDPPTPANHYLLLKGWKIEERENHKYLTSTFLSNF